MRRKKSRDSYIKFKNTADRILAGAGLVILSPVMAGIAIAIKAEEGISAPVFFKQKRVGIHKSHFMLYKFRSMRADTPHDMPTHLLQDPDQYLTKTGKWLRRTSLDELPQLLNIFRGDMAVIGPDRHCGISMICWKRETDTEQTILSPVSPDGLRFTDGMNWRLQRKPGWMAIT